MNQHMSRRRRAAADTHSLRNWKPDLARTVVGGLLTYLTLTFVWSPDGSARELLIAGLFMAGFGLALLGELGWNLVRADGRIAQDLASQLLKENETLRGQVRASDLQEEHIRLLKEEVTRWQRAYNIVEAQTKVMRQYERERAEGREVPFSALLARMEMATKTVTGEWDDNKKAA